VEIIKTCVLVLAVVWTVGQILHTRIQVRTGGIVVPLLVASTLVFALFIVVILITGLSPLHLIWLFPISFVFGIVVLVFPVGTRLILGMLALLALSAGRRHRP
jgi:hypothetical protein